MSNSFIKIKIEPINIKPNQRDSREIGAENEEINPRWVGAWVVGAGRGLGRRRWAGASGGPTEGREEQWVEMGKD